MVQEMHTTRCIFIKYPYKGHNHEINFIAMHLTSWHPYIKLKVLHPCTSPGGRPTQRPHFTIEQNAVVRLLTIEIMNNYYNHANIKSPCPNYIGIESLNGCTMPERRSADDWRISWHPTATGRCPDSHRWATGRSPSGHRPKFWSSAKWIGRPPSSRLAVAGRRLVLDFYDPVQGQKNPAMICRCLKTGIGRKSGDHRTIYKACDVALMAEWLEQASQWHEMYCHDLEVMNLSRVGSDLRCIVLMS